MTKWVVYGSWFLIFSTSCLLTSHAQSITEGFEDVPTMLSTGGWVAVNNSDEPTTTFDWVQGVPTGADGLGLNAQSGPATSFAQVSFEASNGSIVSDWLLTPEVTLQAGATISFWTVAEPGTAFGNDLQVAISLNGASINVGSNAQIPVGGNFHLVTNGDINPTLAVNGYPQAWTEFTFTLTSGEVPAATMGRIGLRYFIPDSDTQGSTIGVDTFSFAPPALPTNFTASTSGNWNDSTLWTPNGIPNGTNNTANLVLPVSGTQTVNLTGATFTVNQLNVTGAGQGAWNVSNGTLIFAGTIPIFTDQSTATGISATIGVNVQLNANTTFDIVNLSAVTEVTGAISGTGQLIKTGSGTLTLTGTDTYSGGTLISAGTLQLGDGVTNGSIAGNVTDNGTLVFDPSGSVSYGRIISGSGNLVKLGTGTVILTGTNTYLGGTTVSAGTLQLGNGVTNGSITGNVTESGTLAFDPVGSVTFGGVISGTGNLVQLGTGTVILTGANTYLGGTTISAGTLQLGDGVTNGSITGDVTNNGTLAFDPNGSVTISAVIGGTGNLVKLGSGTVILTGVNTYTGGTMISAGTLQLGDGATNGSITGDVTDNGTLAFDPNGSVAIAAVISGTGNLVKLGSGTVILTGTNTYAGGTTISAGTLQLGNGVTDGSITGNVTDNGTLTFDLTAPFTFGGAISGTGGVTQIGVGTVILTGNNTYAGTTNVASGVLRAGSPTAFSAGSAFIVNFILDLNGFDNAIGSLAGTGTVFNTKANSLATLTVGGNDASTTFFGAINDQAGTLALVKVGMGTLTLASTSTYSGGTTIENGAVVAASNGALGMGPVTVSEPSNALEINAGATLTNIVTLINGGILNNSGTLNEGASNLTVTNGGTITNSAGGVITASQIQSTGAEVSLFNSGTIHGDIAFANFANTVQLFAGSSIVGNLDLGTEPGANLILDGSGPALLSQAVTGTLTDGGSLVKQGTGTWTLDRDVNVPGLTNITAGTLVLAGQLTSPLVNVGMGAVLQVGNGGGTGSLLGNVVDNGSVLFDRTGTLAFDGIISGAGGVTQGDSGTTVLSAINTYSGGTVVNAGTLVVNSVQALGVGDVVVNGGILTTDPQPINVLGNYTQNAGGTLQLHVAGANPGQYDTLHVTGNATLGGTLQLISSVFQPKAGEQLTLVTTGGAVAGRFAQFLDPYTPGPGFNTINLIYGRNSVLLQFLNMTGPISPVIPTIPPSTPTTVIATINFASFALTPNELAAANLVDRVELNPKAANLIAFLFQEPVANLPGAFEKMSPEGLTAFDEITFSNANIQRLNLEGRLDDIRNGSNGFSSNMKVNGATVNLEDRADADGKSSKAVVEPVLQPGPENRWGVWVTGFGDFVNVDGDGNAQGYNFTTGGVSLGLDYRITDQLAIGVMGEYSHTWTDLKPAGHIDVDSGRGGVYATWFSHGIYINGAIYGGHNNYDSGRASLGGLANGGTEGAEWSTFVGGGYDFHIAQLVVGPIASLQYTEVGIDSFGEKGSLAPLDIHSGSAESLRSDVGFRAFYQWQIGKIVTEPSLKAAWEHEYNYSALPITAGFAGIPGPSATFFGPSEGHDSAVVSAGVSVQVTPAITTYVNYDGQLGRGNYDSNAVTGGVRISF